MIAAAPAALPPYAAQIAPLSAAQRKAMTPSVWRPGCPVPLSDLRRVTLTYVGFDGRAHRGALVVNRSVAAPVARAFGQLYAARFPIRRMLPIEAYAGSDFRSIEADNTSAFNCRSATGSSRWSEHAYGRAIDLDPIENPYVAADGTRQRMDAPAYISLPGQSPHALECGDEPCVFYLRYGRPFDLQVLAMPAHK